MKQKTMILMAVAIVCGLGASYMTSRLLAERNEKVTVLVPKQKYVQWTPIKDPATMFEQREVAKNEAPKTAVQSMDDLKDRILLKTLPEGQPVVQEDLQAKDKNSLESQLPPGKRAIAVKTDATTTGGGFVLPGSRVDVWYALHHGDNTEAKVILQNILVRAVDLQTVKPEDRLGFVPATVTLEVTPEQGLLLTKYKDSGTITLALRPIGDNTEVTGADLSTAPPPPPPAPPAPPAPAKVEVPEKIDRATMTIYNGPHWIQANFITKDGKTTTETQGDAADSVASATSPTGSPSVAASMPKDPQPIAGAAESALNKKDKEEHASAPSNGLSPKEMAPALIKKQ